MKGMKKRVGALALILACSVYANDGVATGNEEQFFEEADVVRLEETTISGDGFENTVRDTPKNITIITARDIEESGAKNVVEAVKSAPGVRATQGMANNGIIDIRGQGATAVQNTSIIVDGVKMNNMDMSGFNLYSIPVETIDKIEIIPSGAAVIYGDNATGGAVVITTKKGSKKDYLTIQSEAGSYESLNSRLGFSSTAGDFKIFGNVGRKTTDGYRENSSYDSDDVSIGTKYKINEYNSLTFKYDYHKDKMEFPGSLTGDQVKDDPTQASTPDDWGKNESHKFNIGYNYKKDDLEIINNLSYFNKNYDSHMAYGHPVTYTDTDSETKRFSNDFKLKYNTDKNKFITGFDLSHGKIDVNESGIKNIAWYPTPPNYQKFETDSWTEKDSYGIFIHDTYSITDNLDLIGGGRYQKSKFNYSDDTDKDYDNYAHELALNYRYSDTGASFISWSSDFRTPATDELVSYGVYNPDLKPQEGENFEIGLKDFVWDTYISTSFFYKKVENEIYYDPIKYINTNYEDPNKKLGFELTLEKKVLDRTTLSFSYSYINSEIDGGTFDGNKTPGVSDNKIHVGVIQDITDKFKANLMLNWYSDYYGYDDLGNDFDKIDSYITLDLNLSYKINPSFDIYGGIKNLTDEEYYEYASGAYNYYYPAAERQYYIGFRYTM
jgi:iron complex outermembrane receptor protein